MMNFFRKKHLSSYGLILLISLSSACKKGDKDSPAVETREPLPQLGALPPFRASNQKGREYGSRELYGKVWLAEFISLADDSQPGKLAALKGQIDAKLGANDVILVSFDSDSRANSDSLMRHAEKLGADHSRQKFLSGSSETTGALRNAFQPAAKQEAAIALVDPFLKIRGFYDPASAGELEQLQMDVVNLLQERFVEPSDSMGPSGLKARRSAQLEAARSYSVFRNFSFSDQTEQSEISFTHKIVDDAGKHYKSVHYDHGNGVAIADVDGDGLSDLFFTTQIGGNELWRNRGGGKFENITGDSGLDLEDRISVSASFADIDNDGDPDLYVTTVRAGNALFENRNGEFRDITKESGLGHKGHSSASVFFDYDRDGLLDLFLTNVGQYTTEKVVTAAKQAFRGDETDYQYHEGFTDAFSGHLKPERHERNLLFKNLGGNRFEDVSEKVGLVDTSWSGAATPIDRNQDGWTDLYILSMQGHDKYYENIGGERFEDKSSEFFPRTPWGAMGVKSFDFDNDGDMDIFVTDMHSDMSESVGPEAEKKKANMQWPESMLQSTVERSIWGNAFFRNLGDGTFEEISDEVGAENYWPWGLSAGDLNADGYDDVFVASSMNYPLRYGFNSVLLNNAGSGFLDSEFVLGVEPREPGRMAAPWFELDLDGADRGHELEARGASGKVVVWSAAGTRSSVLFDIEGDGDLDIVTNEFNTRPMVLMSNLSERHSGLSYVEVRLVGTKSNRDGLGAVVRVHVDGKTYTKVHDGQSGYLSQSSTPLYFGLDGASEITKVGVVWPSGLEQTLEGPILVNREVVIKEPAAAE